MSSTPAKTRGRRRIAAGLLAVALVVAGTGAAASAQDAGAGPAAAPPADSGPAPVPAMALPAASPDALPPLPPTPAELKIAESRKTTALVTTGLLYAGLYGWTYLAWYQRNPESEGFEFIDEGWFGEDTYAGGADKIGHFYANYALTRTVSGILEWGGYPRRTALPAALGLTAGFFLMSEIKDGYHHNYGFSWGDVVVNLLGDATAVLFELNPRVDEMFDIRLQYFPSPGYIDAISEGNPFNSPEDYSGQSYLLAYHLSSNKSVRESPTFGWLQWFDVTLGYRAVNYLPENDKPHVQQLYVGFAVSLQHLVDRYVMPRGEGAGKQQPSTGARALRFATEIYQPPYTSLEFDVIRHESQKHEEPEQAAP